MHEIENNPSMWDVGSFTVPYSRFLLKQYIENTQSDIFADKQLRLMIIRNSDSSVLGTLDLSDYVPLHSRAAIGIALKEEFRHEGYANEAVTLVCDYAFEFLKLHQLYVHISIENQKSISLFQNCGFMRTGLLSDWLISADGYIDAIIMQKINPIRL